MLLVFSLSACAPQYKHPPFTTPTPPAPAETPTPAEPKELRSLRGWERPYVVFGERYEPMLGDAHIGFVEEGLASWYGTDFHGKKTSNGEIYDMHARTAAHKTLPMGITVRVTNLNNGRELLARINDRGPFVKGRIIDLSHTLAKDLDIIGPGTAPVRVEALGYQETDASGRVTYRQPRSYTIGNYAVQIGAFTVRDNADRLAGQMRARHGSASIQEGWVNGQLFYRVRVGKYTTLETAEKAKFEFEQGGYSNSFVVAME
jgi:rare lipoprotein A